VSVLWGSLRRALPAVVPAPVRDPAQRWGLLSWLGLGLGVRFALMPFTVSADFLAVYWRSHVVAYDGVLFGSYLVNMTAHYAHALALRLFEPLLPPADVLWPDAWFFDDFVGLAPQVIRDFSAAEQVHQTLFVLKLPYLAADLAAGLMILALVARCRPALVRRAWALWMLSPIGLYAGYVFGRYEAFPIALVVAALLCVERRRPWWGAVLLGLAVTTRTYPLLLIPLFALLAVRGPARQAAWAAVAVTPFAVVMATNRLLAGTVGEIARLADFPTGNTFLAYRVAGVPVFPVYALALVTILAARAWGRWGEGPEPVSRLWMWLLALHAGMFALSPFSAHYLAWMTPFIAVAVARRPGWPALAVHLSQAAIALAVADLLGGPGVTLGLFEPAHPAANALPSLRTALLTGPVAADVAIVGLRVLFGVVMLVLLCHVAAELARPVAPDQEQREAGDQQRAPGERERRLRDQSAGRTPAEA
jgi:hypothetical protein